VFSGSAETIRKGSPQCSGLAVSSLVSARTAVPGNPRLVNTLPPPPGGFSSRPLSTAARSPAPHSSWRTRDQPYQVHPPRHGIPTRTPGPRLSGPGSRLDSPDFRDGFDLVPAGGPGLSTRNGTEGTFPGPLSTRNGTEGTFPGPCVITEARDSDSDARAAFRATREPGPSVWTSGTVSTWSGQAARDFLPATALRATSPGLFGTETAGPSLAGRRPQAVYPREPIRPQARTNGRLALAGWAGRHGPP
jgi:hypothetical protein